MWEVSSSSLEANVFLSEAQNLKLAKISLYRNAAILLCGQTFGLGDEVVTIKFPTIHPPARHLKWPKPSLRKYISGVLTIIFCLAHVLPDIEELTTEAAAHHSRWADDADVLDSLLKSSHVTQL